MNWQYFELISVEFLKLSLFSCNNYPEVYIMEKERNLASIEEKAYQIRIKKEMTQKEFAKRINTYRFLISDYETGRKSISTADLKQICETFGYSADWCVGKITECVRYKPVKKLKAREVKGLISN